MELTSLNVQTIMRDCLYDDAELENGIIPSNTVLVDGITRKFGFNPMKLELQKDNIVDMLSNLPDAFMKDKGGGMTFLKACDDKDGNQWTGVHAVMEELFCLGMAIGKVQYCLSDREMWGVFPGAMPYLVVDLNGGVE